MPLEIDNLALSARMAPDPQAPARLPDAEIERIARRVIAILQDEARTAQMARTDGSALSILDEM